MIVGIGEAVTALPDAFMLYTILLFIQVDLVALDIKSIIY